MIIWGSKAKEHQIGSGTFFCPRCMTDSPYQHMRVSRYFTLYFIPLFPTSTLGQYVNCGTCNSQIPETVLSYTREQILDAVQPWTCPKCNNRNPGSQATCLQCGGTKGALPSAITPPPLPPA